MGATVHVVVGAGSAGLAVVDELLARDEPVRLVSGDEVPGPVGVEVQQGDLTDGEYLRRVARDADVIYLCPDLPFHRWAAELEPMHAAAIHAATRLGCRLVVLDDALGYGPYGGRHITEALEPRAVTRKGMLRIKLTEQLLEAHEDRRIEVAIGRAADWFGPRAGSSGPLGDHTIRQILAGEPVPVPGIPELPHTYAFLPDVAMGLVMLGLHDQGLGQIWHLPAPETRTTAEVIGLLCEEAGRPTVIKKASRRAMRAELGPRERREWVELRYLYAEPFILSSSKFEETFGVPGTKLRDAARRTITWHRERAEPS